MSGFDLASSDSHRRRELLLLFATVLFGSSVRGGSTTGVAALIASISLAGALFTREEPMFVDTAWGRRGWETQLMISVVVFGLLGVTGWSPASIGPTSSELERLPGVLWVVASIVVFISGRGVGRLIQGGVVVITLGATLLLGLNHLSAAEGVGFDVYFLHVEAAEAIANGHNPYTDVVEVPNGSPTAEPGDVITGYVYPPVTAASYSLAYWVFSDPRFTSLIAWLAFLGLIGIRAFRRQSRAGLLVMLLMASIPGWPLVLRAAWTEPLSLAFLAGAFFLWKRPVTSGAFLGMALASKQYFAVTAPLLLLHRESGWVRRAMVAGAVIAATIGAVILWDAGAFWSAAVEFHTSTPPRPDGLNLVGLASLLGLSWNPPTFLALAAGLLVAIAAGRRSAHRAGFMLALGLTLAASFLFSSQAFANYWFLIAGLCGLALWDSSTGLGADVDIRRQEG
jgi:hypothetical protein